MHVTSPIPLFFFFNDTATTEIYTLSLHDALPISFWWLEYYAGLRGYLCERFPCVRENEQIVVRSEEHTSELQSQSNLVCRLLLEKKKKNATNPSRAYAHLDHYST